MADLMFLKSGTDIRGTGSPASGEPQLSDAVVCSVTAALVKFLRTQKNNSVCTVAVGCDSRISSPRIKKCVLDTLASLGVRALDCSLASTPSMFTATVNSGCDAAVQVTASHLPSEMNGLKIFTKDGGFSGGDISQILKMAGEAPLITAVQEVEHEKSDNMEVYSAGLCEMIKQGVDADDYNKPLKGLKIVVDAGNGVGGFYAGKVLEPLGADCTGSVYLEPDGNFPNHIPNPENAVAMRSIREATLAAGADLGVIFDTDVDRAACVGADGEEINRNKLVALASVIALKDCPGGTVVTDSVTSDGLADFIENTLGGRHRRFKRGYKNVIDEAVRLSSIGTPAPLAIETSGHAAFSTNYYLDDGAYLMTRIIIELARLRREGKELTGLISQLSEPLEEREIRYRIALDDFKPFGTAVIDKLGEYASEYAGITPAAENCEGLRLSFNSEMGDGWLLLRMSVHEPLLVMNCESDIKGGVNRILEWFEPFIGGFKELSVKS